MSTFVLKLSIPLAEQHKPCIGICLSKLIHSSFSETNIFVFLLVAKLFGGRNSSGRCLILVTPASIHCAQNCCWWFLDDQSTRLNLMLLQFNEKSNMILDCWDFYPAESNDQEHCVCLNVVPCLWQMLSNSTLRWKSTWQQLVPGFIVATRQSLGVHFKSFRCLWLHLPPSLLWCWTFQMPPEASNSWPIGQQW